MFLRAPRELEPARGMSGPSTFAAEVPGPGGLRGRAAGAAGLLAAGAGGGIPAPHPETRRSDWPARFLR